MVVRVLVGEVVAAGMAKMRQRGMVVYTHVPSSSNWRTIPVFAFNATRVSKAMRMLAETHPAQYGESG